MAAEQVPPPRDTVSERYGPRVHRAVHHGAILLLVGVVVFIAGMAITQIGYGSSYSLTNNFVSDLGAVHCSTVSAGSLGGSSRYVCSPWNVVFNATIIVMGVLTLVAAVLLRTAFPVRRSRTVGLILLALVGVGSIGVGLAPEDTNVIVHVVSALIAFLGGSFALMTLGFAMFRDTRWNGFRAYSILSGMVSFVALLLFVTKNDFALGVGGMERLVIAPFLLWGIVVGVHLARIPTFAPRLVPKGSAT